MTITLNGGPEHGRQIKQEPYVVNFPDLSLVPVERDRTIACYQYNGWTGEYIGIG